MNTITDDQIAEIELDFQCARKLGREAYIDMQDGEALIARLREAERDAARYRWMLKHYGEFHGERTLAALALQHGSLDAAIDAAMMSAREAEE